MENNNWSRLQRQPAAALVYVFYQTMIAVIKVLFPLLIVLLFRSSDKKNNNTWEYVAMALPVITLVIAFLNYLLTRFFIDEHNRFILHKGIFTRKQIILPLEKIQAVNIRQQWLHRLLRLSEVRMDTPGTEGEGARITITNKQAASLRQYILQLKGGQESDAMIVEPASKKNRLYHLDEASLIKLGLTANHIETFFITLTFGYGVLRNIQDVSSDYYDRSMNLISAYTLYNSFLGLLIVALVVIFISILISFFRIVLQYANFEIFHSGNSFMVRMGLINTRETLIPFSKIQYVQWHANWLRTKTNMYLLQFFNIGESGLKEAQKVKIPLTRLEYLPGLLSAYHKSMPGMDGTAIRIDPRYVQRVILLFILPPVMLIALLGYFYPMYYWLLGIPLYHAIGAYLLQRKFRLYMNEEAIYINRGKYGRNEQLMAWDKIQSMELTQSIYQRGKDLASLRFQTAGGPITVPYIPLSTARELINYASYITATKEWK